MLESSAQDDFASLKKLQNVIQTHVKAQSYAVVKMRSKNDSKIDTLKKIHYSCSRENSSRLLQILKKKISSIKCDCF